MEESNNPNPEVTSEKKPKKSFKKFLIIGIVLVLLVVAAIVALVLTGKVSFSKKSKLFNTISKAKEVVAAPIDALMSGEEVKVANKIADKDIEYSAEISASLDTLELPVAGSQVNEKSIETIKKLVNGTKLNLDMKVDPKEKALEGTAKVSVADLLDEISANFTYKNNAAAVSIPTLSDKKIGVFADSLTGTQSSELKEIFDMIQNIDMEGMVKSISKLQLTEEEVKHFKDTYKDLFKKQIESDMLKTGSGEIKVDGKTKKCNEVVLTLKDKDVQKIVKAYVEAFKDDKEGKEIIADKVFGIIDIVKKAVPQAASSLNVGSKEDFIKQLDTAVDELKGQIDSIKFDGQIVITAYASLVKTYGLDIEYKQDSNKAGAYIVFTKDGADFDVKVNGEKMLSGEFVNKKDNQALKINFDQSGAKANVEVGVKAASKTESSVYVKGDVEAEGKKGTFDISANTKVNSNTDSEYATETKLAVNVDVQDVIKLVCSLKIKDSIKSTDVNIENIDRTNTIDALSPEGQTELQKYMTEIEPKLNEITKKVQESDLMKDIQSLMTSVPSTNTFGTNSYDYNSTYGSNTYGTNSYDYNSTYGSNSYDYNSLYTNMYDTNTYGMNSYNLNSYDFNSYMEPDGTNSTSMNGFGF